MCSCKEKIKMTHFQESADVCKNFSIKLVKFGSSFVY